MVIHDQNEKSMLPDLRDFAVLPMPSECAQTSVLAT
ncbi:hypothetical protein FB461_1696 [Rarobacter faecitabidus]|uniref:Uncharacterized protein n=1 Tax=Rarobacter faecitabidus TaxID=13243 RepID=A0A542ZNX6_RARFA|nr:hypothetical protein FB461_1696 [Rarobacter faecitabidus]